MHNLTPTCVHAQNSHCWPKITGQNIVCAVRDERKLDTVIEQPFEGNDRTDEKDCGCKKRKGRLGVSIEFQELPLGSTSPSLSPAAKPHLTLH